MVLLIRSVLNTLLIMDPALQKLLRDETRTADLRSQNRPITEFKIR